MVKKEYITKTLDTTHLSTNGCATKITISLLGGEEPISPLPSPMPQNIMRNAPVQNVKLDVAFWELQTERRRELTDGFLGFTTRMD